MATRELDQVDEVARGQAETFGAHGRAVDEEHAGGDDCPCPRCYPNEALSIADRGLLWALIGEREANPTTRRSE